METGGGAEIGIGSGPRMVGVGMGDHRPGDGSPRVDVKVSIGAVQASRGEGQEFGHRSGAAVVAAADEGKSRQVAGRWVTADPGTRPRSGQYGPSRFAGGSRCLMNRFPVASNPIAR